MTVAELMTRVVHVCTPGDSLDQAAHVMWEADCGCVPVVDDTGRALAMLTDRDVCMAAYTRGRPLREMTVESAASRRLVFLRPSDEVATAEQRMREYGIRRLPVVGDDGKLVGLLTMNDLARHARTHEGHGHPSVEGVVKTLAAVCAPRPLA